MVAREGVVLAAIGASVGTTVALAAAGGLRGLLYGVAPLDATNVLAVASIVFVMALVAASVPAWRAGRVDPSVALRAE